MCKLKNSFVYLLKIRLKTQIMALKIGDKIPELLGIDADGNEVMASQFKGKKLVIYFYPKDNTLGCTAEACSLSNGYDNLLKAGYAVIGVSKDSVASHRKFSDKYSLPFKLIADTELVLNKAFGVWQEKKMCGKVYMGTVRTTFVTDENGVITHIINKVNTKDAANQILKEIK